MEEEAQTVLVPVPVPVVVVVEGIVILTTTSPRWETHCRERLLNLVEYQEENCVFSCSNAAG
jgi:hypothetical protein